MIYLLIASVVWAFSFGLIKHVLVGVGLDPAVVACIRLWISALLFLPFLRPRVVTRHQVAGFLALGVVQYGLMYMSYLWAYRFLQAHEVALFTVFTPLFVALCAHRMEGPQRSRPYGAAGLAVLGAALVVTGGERPAGSLIGFGLMQVSNVCFAFGQVAYRRLAGSRDSGIRDRDVFAWLYVGGAVTATAASIAGGGWQGLQLGGAQVATLLYLGILPSGVCFFLWNAGARRVGAGMLAAMNNVKVPLAALCAVLVFGERTDWPWLGGGVVLMALAVWVSRKGCRAEA